MKIFFVPLLFVLCISENLVGMDQAIKPLPTSGGPMNAEWFCHPDNPFKKANDLHQKHEWQAAAKEYELILSIRRTDKYSYHMAKIKLAECLIAQGKPTEHWKSFDALLDIDKAKRLPKKIDEDPTLLHEKRVFVATNYVDVENIFRFMQAAHVLQNRFGCYVILSVPDSLKDTLQSLETTYNLGIVGEKSYAPLICDYETHIMSLLGHLKLSPDI